jgi:hypothetical protein
VGIAGTAQRECDGCGRRGSSIQAIDSGQRLCGECRGQIVARPRHLATQRQLEFARALGFAVSADTSRMQLETMLVLHRDVRFFVFDVWKEMTGERPRESGISVMEIMQFVTWLVASRKRLAMQVSRIERVRERQAKAERDRLVRKLGPGTEVDLADIKPRPLHDATYRAVAAEMKRKLGSDTCKFGILSSVIMRRSKQARTGGGKPARQRRVHTTLPSP